MQKRFFRWELAGFLFVGAAGTLLHFVYDWTGRATFAAAFSAVNESTWEHMKLLFVPFFLFTMVQFLVHADALRSLLAVRCAGLLVGLAAIPTVFYTLSGAFGETPDWVNIAIFFLADAMAFLTSGALLRRGKLRSGVWQLAGFVLLWLLAFAFVLCTFRPPHLPLWQAPTGGYGIAA